MIFLCVYLQILSLSLTISISFFAIFALSLCHAYRPVILDHPEHVGLHDLPLGEGHVVELEWQNDKLNKDRRCQFDLVLPVDLPDHSCSRHWWSYRSRTCLSPGSMDHARWTLPPSTRPQRTWPLLENEWWTLFCNCIKMHNAVHVEYTNVAPTPLIWICLAFITAVSDPDVCPSVRVDDAVSGCLDPPATWAIFVRVKFA